MNPACLLILWCLLIFSQTVVCRKSCGRRQVEHWDWGQNLVGRVVGGHPAVFGEVPWQAGIREKRLFGLFNYRKCGAVVIHRKWLLTAAHCTSTWYFSELIAVMGEHKMVKSARKNDTRRNQVQKRKVKRIIIHPAFNKRALEDDIALIELEQPLRYDINIQPICLPDKGEDFTRHDGYVSGWGFTAYRAGPLPSVLQVVKLPIISNDKCRQMYSKAGYSKQLPSTAVCAGYAEGGKDSCEGDSGGPLMVWSASRSAWVLVGVVSNGIRCAEPNLPGIYVRISEYTNWISKYVKW